MKVYKTGLSHEYHPIAKLSMVARCYAKDTKALHYCMVLHPLQFLPQSCYDTLQASNSQKRYNQWLGRETSNNRLNNRQSTEAINMSESIH